MCFALEKLQWLNIVIFEMYIDDMKKIATDVAIAIQKAATS